MVLICVKLTSGSNKMGMLDANTRLRTTGTPKSRHMKNIETIPIKITFHHLLAPLYE